VKTLHFASILVLASAVTFACGDDDDETPIGSAGSSGAAGKNGTAGSSTAGKNGTAGSSTAGTGGSTAGAAGSTTDAGAGGVGGAGDLGGAGGAGGANEGGFGGVGGEGLGGEAGSAGEGSLGGAGGEGGAPVVPDVLVNGPVELIGTWKDPEWGGLDVITATTWNGANIVGYDSDAKTVYWHNPASSFYPGKYTKVVFTAPVSDAFYYCQIVYNAESLAAAKADTKVADASKLEENGCSGFDWTKVVKQP
jgi:hypothetical protein